MHRHPRPTTPARRRPLLADQGVAGIVLFLIFGGLIAAILR